MGTHQMTQADDCLESNPGTPNGNRGNGEPLEAIKPAGPMPSTIVDEAQDQERCRQLHCATKTKMSMRASSSVRRATRIWCFKLQLEMDAAPMCMSGAVALQEGQAGSKSTLESLSAPY